VVCKTSCWQIWSRCTHGRPDQKECRRRRRPVEDSTSQTCPPVYKYLVAMAIKHAPDENLYPNLSTLSLFGIVLRQAKTLAPCTLNCWLHSFYASEIKDCLTDRSQSDSDLTKPSVSGSSWLQLPLSRVGPVPESTFSGSL